MSVARYLSVAASLSAPGHRDRPGDPLATALLLAGEALAAPYRTPGRPVPAAEQRCAGPASDAGSSARWLLDVVDAVVERLGGGEQHAEFVAALSEAYGERDVLAHALARLFPERRAVPPPCGERRALLTRRQVELLREASRDVPHKEIARRLRIAPRTVDTHFAQIYRRLGVSKPMQAVARAVALGYLEMDTLEFVHRTTDHDVLDEDVLYRLLAGMTDTENATSSSALRRVADVGLALMLVGGAAAIPLRSDRLARSRDCGVVLHLSRSGEVLGALGAGRLAAARGVCVAPPSAADRGFTPGHLYVVSDGLAQRDLNTAEIVELAPDGSSARAFAGAPSTSARLADAACLAFHLDGRLLATSGWLTDGVLAFSEGGRRVERFADGRVTQLAAGPTGKVLLARSGQCAAPVGVLARSGAWERDIGDPLEEGSYDGIAVASTGEIALHRVHPGRSAIETYSAAGAPERLWSLPGSTYGMLAVDHLERLYVLSHNPRRIVVYTIGGELVERIPLPAGLAAYGVAIGADGSLWVSGEARLAASPDQ